MEHLKWIDDAFEKSLKKIKNTHDNIGVSFPHVEHDGKYDCTSVSFWTSGFYGGILWLYYNEIKDEEVRNTACKIEKELHKHLDDFYPVHHDVGFMYLPNSVMRYNNDGDAQAKKTALIAASHLAGRFNLSGKFIRAWTDDVNPNSVGYAIIDCLMNLPLLYWATKETNDPRFKQIAIAHTNTVLEKFVREDNTVPHIVNFDANTGDKIENLGGQGFSPDSVWARGQAWAIYGLTIAYRENNDERYLNAAKNIANYFISHLPDDKVPIWDFKASKETAYARDSSAATCVASGLIDLSRLISDTVESEFYLNKALEILKSIYENYSDFTFETDAIVQKGTVHLPAGRNINVPIIYGDFFFLEALVKLKGGKGIF